MILPGKYNNVEAQYVENEAEKQILIQSLQYLPKFLQDKALFKDASKLLDACLSQEVDVLAQIHQAYCDTLYKIAAYQQLSYNAKTELLKEKGFEYILELLKNIYEEKYNQLTPEQQKTITLTEYLEQETANNLANITMLFNLLYILKGKTLGLELALQLVNCPEYIYLTWDVVANYKGEVNSWEDLPLPGGSVEVKKGDVYTVNLGGAATTDAIFNGVSWHKCTSYEEYLTPRQQFTAELTIWGIASSSLQVKIAEFVRNYMLPYIEIKLKFTADTDSVIAFPSGDLSILRSYNLVHYYENNILIKRNLEHEVSQYGWGKGQLFNLPITIGQPIFNGKAFQGNVDLKTSFIQSGEEKHYLYGEQKIIPDFITGTALDSITSDGTVTFTGNDYVSSPLEMEYTIVDIVTGDQINPHYENDEFIRDTIIKFRQNLLVGGIHLQKTVEEMEQLLIEDFGNYADFEVYAGRVTNVHCTNPSEVMYFINTLPTVRENTGVEDTIHLRFSDAVVDADKYTGIGDLGILGSNSYFIYNGMLFWNNADAIQIDPDNTWIDVGASHPVSKTYYTPAIKNNKLYYLKDDKITAVENVDNIIWKAVTGYINEYYHAFAIAEDGLYILSLDNDSIVTSKLDDGIWTFITGAYYSSTYEAYGIKESKLYTLSNTIKEMTLDGQELTGWDGSFNCISRYHHSNADYITYGICNGKLYYIQDTELHLLNNDTDWTAVCGFYNDNSPRTFGYALKNGDLYELQGTQIILKDAQGWQTICGCTTTTNTFALGIKDGFLYKIAAKPSTPTKLQETNGWTNIFGRYTTSTSKNADCYAYGVRNNRLHVLHIQEDTTIPGMWKINGEGTGVNLQDYNIEDISVTINGHHIVGIENVRTQVPIDNEPQSTYDIDVTYETVGFDNNTRYQVKTEMSDVYNTYIDPQLCRDNVYMDNCPPFDTATGYISNFTQCPLIIHGNQKINGEGEAYEFDKTSYLEIPIYYDIFTDEYGQETQVEKPITQATFKVGCIIGESLLPIILDTQGNGIFYGTDSDTQTSGIFVKNTTINRLIPCNMNQDIQFYIRLDSSFRVSYSLDGQIFNDSEYFMDSPRYLGGNGTIFGDSIFFLQECSIVVTDLIPLYESGKYFELDTLNQDVILRVITSENQESQKIIQLNDAQGTKIIDLYMNSIYVSREVECTAENLKITDSFVDNTLNFGDNEGISTSTLVYSGEYTLDPEKAKPVGNIKEVSKYYINTQVNNFTTEDYICVSPYENLVIKTGQNVDTQILFQTEEHTAYTNNYLLTTQLTGSYSNNEFYEELSTDPSQQNHLVPSGILFNLLTNSPGTITKTLQYNAQTFEIDGDKIYNYQNCTFDDYTAMLSNFNSVGTQEDYFPCIINFDLQEVKTENNKIYYDVLPILKIVTADTYKQQIAKLGEYPIYIGNKFLVNYDEEGNPIEDLESYEGEITTETEIDEDVFPFEDNTPYWMKLDIMKESFEVQNVNLHETTSTEPKDKFVIQEGRISNFSTENYIITESLTTKKSVEIKFTSNDDISLDQGLFGLPNNQAISIKDNLVSLFNEQGQLIEVAETRVTEEEDFYLKIEKDEEIPNIAYIYIKLSEDEDWEILFENTITLQDEMYIGFCNTGVESMPFNGSIDLTRSFYTTEENEIERYYKFNQTTTIKFSKDGQVYDEDHPIVINTPYPVESLEFGYNFTGNLDMYGSDLLLPYNLEWLDDKIPVDTVIKNTWKEADPSYVPELDPNTYTIEEYGIHLQTIPQRMDTIQITYNTKDNAYYMLPNTKYYLKCDTQIDENGKCILTKINNPSWNEGIVSNFDSGYYSIDFTNESCIVIHCTTTSTEDQVLCGYPNNGQRIEIKEGKWQYFDDTNYYPICEALPNEDVYFKLYTSSNNIEYYKHKWITTDIVASFTGYETFNIGSDSVTAFKGSINFNDSYTITDQINYFFAYYKKITPYISRDNITWYPLVIEPMLTLKDMINFGQKFDGTLYLVDSNLLLEDSTYWTATQINIYSIYDIPEDNIHANDLVRTIIRDSYQIDTSKYWSTQEKVKVNPETLKLHIDGLPLVGDTITLTYNSWYLFREQNHEYDFKLSSDGDKINISYIDITTNNEFIIYSMLNDNLKLSFGYNFWGTLSVKDSYRGGMMLCNYLEWYRYIISYRKYGDLDWIQWSEFSRESRYSMFQHTGFQLKDKMYLESSYIKFENLVSPFLAFWNGNYITIVGGPSIEDGVASAFSADDYLLLKSEELKDGDIVSLDIQILSTVDQGISSNLYLSDSYIQTPQGRLQEVYPNYRVIVEYHIENGQAYVQVVGNNTSNFELNKSQAYSLTIIPYNEKLQDTQTGYYIKSEEDAQNLKIFYRLGSVFYDHYMPPALDWHPITLQKVDEINYYGQILTDIYVAKIDLGFTYDAAGNPTNVNPDGLIYYDNADIEYKIVSPLLTSTNKTVLYTNRTEKQRTLL